MPPQCRAIWAECRFLKGLDRKQLADIVPGLSSQVTRNTAAESTIGINQMDWALADTGTLAQDLPDFAQELASSLPAIHVVLVATDGILADMPSLLTKINLRESGDIFLITGPSRTADKEPVLTIGAQGPERLIIVFVDGPGGMN